MRSSPFSVLAAQGVTLPSSEAYVSPDLYVLFFMRTHVHPLTTHAVKPSPLSSSDGRFSMPSNA
jgi:hypothetical protein